VLNVLKTSGIGLLMLGGSLTATQAAEDYATWPLLQSTFPSTGGGGIMIKGYDPVIAGDTCMTTFMAVTSDATPAVYANYIEFKAIPEQGGILCTSGQWRSFDGKSAGTTPFQLFFKDGKFRSKG
jgi:hypothetical protein